MKTVSVSEILAWQTCPSLWDLRYSRRLVPTSKAPQLVSGIVVHELVAGLVKGTISRDKLEEEARTRLRREFETSSEDGEAQTKKYLAGVLRAVGRVPSWVWTSEGWHSEELIEYQATSDLVVRMKPDLWRLGDDDVLDLVELKNSDTDPLSYLLWNPQHQWYGLALQEIYPTSLVRFRYVVVSSSKLVEHMPVVFTTRALDYAKRELIRGGLEVGGPIWLRRGRHCDFCDYKLIHQVVLTGGDEESIIAEEFRTRERIR